MLFLLLSFAAGILTILAPCILPLLPIVIGTTDGAGPAISRKTWTVILSLAVSIIVFTLLLKASTLLITIPNSFWTTFSGFVLIVLGVIMLFPKIWTSIPLIRRLNIGSNKLLGQGHLQNNAFGDILIGLSLGPVFTTCSPTYLFILATVLPAQPIVGFVYLIAFVIGLMLALLAVAYFGNKLIQRYTASEQTTQKVKKVFAVLFVLVGLAIMTGYDKKVETYIIDLGIVKTIELEDFLIRKVTE